MLIDIFRYKQWADRRTLDAARSVEESETSTTLAFIRQQLNHMITVEELFKARLLGEDIAHHATNTKSVPALDEIDHRLTQSDRWLADYVADLSDGTLSEKISFQFVDGKQGCMSRLEILFHLVNHGTYHRGAIGHALDSAKAVRPADTYTVFIHESQPERRLQI